MADIQNQQLDLSDLKLKRYYYVVEISGIITPFIFGLIFFFFPQYFPWILYPELNVVIFAILFVVHTLFFILNEIYQKKIFFTIARYEYLFFFVYWIYVTGGVNSSFTQVLVFPLITSVAYLDGKLTRNTGIVMCVLYSLIILFSSEQRMDPILIIKHLISLSLCVIISYLVYRIVQETLRQKFQKEETDKKLVEVLEVDKLKTDFLTMAQHQLRTPLNATRWAIDSLLADSSLNENQKAVLTMSYERVNKSIGIVNEMLSTVEGEKDTFELSYERVDISKLIHEILSELNYLAVDKGVKVTYVVDTAIEIDIDRTLMKSALTNVIDNALVYSPKATVDIKLYIKEDNLGIEIKDTGMGIHTDDLPYVFERLHRGANAVSLEPDKSGVGLYMAKRIIEMHQGSLKLDSVLGSGTTVWVILPLQHHETFKKNL